MKKFSSFLTHSVRISILACILTLISFIGYSQLSGTIYTIDPAGGAFPNFVSFQAAVDSLHNMGVSGPVEINVADGIYTEKIQINSIPGASATNRITFQSQSLDSTAVTLRYECTSNTSIWTLRLNYTSFVTIRKMRIQGLSNNWGRVININGTAHDNIIENCQILSNNSSTYDSELIWSGNDETANITIRNNLLMFGNYGIDMEGIGSSQLGTGLEVYGNTFIDQKYTSILIDVYDAPKIFNNTISSSGSSGIRMEFCFNDTEVRDNIINMDNGVGIDIHRSKGNALFKIQVSNNFVSMSGGASQGINTYISEHVNIYHNSVLNTNSNTQDHICAYMLDDYSPTGYSSEIDLRNNIFANFGGGPAVLIESDWAVTSDYNNFYAASGLLAVWNGDQPDLQSHQNTSDEDVNSVSIHPRFLSNDDLHVDNYWLSGVGDATTGITHDIDGDLRSSPPDIGADEFDPSRLPLATGSYTIGGSSPDYLTISDAMDDLNLVGIAGPVTFIIRDGDYPECVSQISQINGASATDTIVLKSESGNSTIYFATDETANRTIIDLNGTDYFTLMDLTVSSTGADFGKPIRVRGKCNNLNFLNNTLACNNIVDEVLSIWGSEIQDITIRNNYFSKGKRGLIIYSDPSIYANNTVIEDNTFMDGYNGGIMMRYHVAPIVRNNTVSNTDHWDCYGIWARDCEKDIEITGNRISLQSGGYGLRLNDCLAVLPFQGLTANNMVHVGGGAVNSYGIQVDDCSRQQIFYNSVNVSSADPNKGRAFYSQDGNAELNIINNIFANTGGGYAMFVNDPADITNSNYNGFYAAGTNLAQWGTASDHTSLASLAGASGMDGNSIETDPMFYSDSDLHTLQEDFHEAATPLTEVLTDIDGKPRDAVEPDIGAEEITCLDPEFNVYILPVCLGDTTLIIDSTTNITPGSTRGWDMNGDAVQDLFTDNQYDTIKYVFPPGSNSINYILSHFASCNYFTNIEVPVIPDPEL
ncbi:right-handed parallel beta-helix repeat-containing protein, partial [Bacteroidota bacterium]